MGIAHLSRRLFVKTALAGAAGTLIPENTVVEPGSLWMGSPGKFRRKLEEKDQEAIMRYAENYLGYTEEYLRER